VCEEKFGINFQLRNELFLIVLFYSSIGESGMNAQRLCKLRKDRLTGGHGAIVLKKRLHFFFFQLPWVEKGLLRIANCGGVEFSKFR
jgi:hypothetical protein